MLLCRPLKIVLTAMLLILSPEAAASPEENAGPQIVTTDAERFYALYDEAKGELGGETLQRVYLDRGSPGLLHLAKSRRVSGASIALALQARPQVYRNARLCLETLPNVKKRTAAAMTHLKQLYPAAHFPTITIAVSHTKPVGMADAQGVQISLEALCATRYMNPDHEDRFVHVLVHEFAHSQQKGSVGEKETPTVLEQALLEGGAEFIAELISGSPGNLGPFTLAKGREREIESRFLIDMEKIDLSEWFFNGSNERPGDLGYWVGYRIVRSYYQRTTDKTKALEQIFHIDDAADFLSRSGWHPGKG